MLVKIKYANIINIAAKKEIIPELLQSKCNPNEIFRNVSNYLEDHNKIAYQIDETQKIIKEFKTQIPPAEAVAEYLKSHI